MTYEQAFEKIKEKLKDADTSNLTGDFAVQIDLINKDCSGMFYIALCKFRRGSQSVPERCA